MKETDFIDQNKDKWALLETHVRTKKRHRKYDHVGDQFVQLSEDLSYAQTYYPRRSVRLYLNGLAQRMYKSVFNARTVDKKSKLRFWSHELPTALWESRLELTVALGVFLLAAFIGVVSSQYEDSFASQILGSNYVHMTEENIANGDPMGVYKDMDALPMFFMIMYNNLQVSAIFFVMGILFGVGTLGILFRNGVMLGVFQYFFFQRDLGFESMLTIWQHGTIEIASAVVAGGAGLVLGRAIIFPGTLPRAVSLKFGFLKGLKILLGVAPLIVIAAFIESFFTRFDDLPDIIRVISILTSLAFIIGYYVILPLKRGRKISLLKDVSENYSQSHVTYELELNKLKNNGENLSDALIIIQQKLAVFMRLAIWPAVVLSLTILFFLRNQFEGYLYFVPFTGFWMDQVGIVFNEVVNRMRMLQHLFEVQSMGVLPLLAAIVSWITIGTNNLLQLFLPNQNLPKRKLGPYSQLIILNLVFLSPIYVNLWFGLLYVLVLMPVASVAWYIFQSEKRVSIFGSAITAVKSLLSLPFRYVGMLALSLLFSLLVAFLVQSPVIYLLFELANDFIGFAESGAMQLIDFTLLFVVFVTLFCGISFVMLNAILNYRSVVEIKEANNLLAEIESLKPKRF